MSGCFTQVFSVLAVKHLCLASIFLCRKQKSPKNETPKIFSLFYGVQRPAMVTRMDKRPLTVKKNNWQFIFSLALLVLKTKKAQKQDPQNILPFYGVQ